MKQTIRGFALAATAVLLIGSGCGSIGEALLGAIKKDAEKAIETATSQAVERAATEIETRIEQQIIQGIAGSGTAG